MLNGLSRLCVGVIAVVGVLALMPTVAFADNCGGPSSVNIYSECIPTAGGGTHPTKKPVKKPADSGSTSTPWVAPATVPVSKHVRHTLKHAGADKRILHALVADPWLGATRGVETSGPITASAPSALGSAFDLGAGPTVLFSLLLATALLLLGVGGVRSWRQRQR